jgi:hypothetical protein
MTEAATYRRDSLVGVPEDELSACLPKVYVESLQSKEKMRQDEKAIMGAYHIKDPIEVVTEAAKAGTWIFISSFRFPTYAHKLISLLDKLKVEGKIKSTFRLFIDL